jgi:hypothetical protein
MCSPGSDLATTKKATMEVTRKGEGSALLVRYQLV